MNLIEALHEIAQQLDLPTDELAHYAAEDTVGGYEPGNPNTPWSCGSMFGVEGQVLYALTRALRPERIGEFGTHDGCSATHFLAALEANGDGALFSVDPWEGAGSLIPRKYRSYLAQLFSDGVEFLSSAPDASFDILFEDMLHGVDGTRDWWQVAQRKIKPGGLIISHDAAHFLVGKDVMRGIVEAGVSDARVYLIEPSDCGLALWRAPMVETLEYVDVVSNLINLWPQQYLASMANRGEIMPEPEPLPEPPVKKRKPRKPKAS